MPNKTIYVKQADAELWAAAVALGRQQDRSVSDVLAEGLRLVMDKYGVEVPEQQLSVDEEFEPVVIVPFPGDVYTP